MSNTTEVLAINQDSADDFPMIPITPSAQGRRKPIAGHGINDADYLTQRTINGKGLYCPFYSEWASMLKRVYSKSYHKKRLRHIGTSVHPPWLYFMTFRAWMVEQEWLGKYLDKDIIRPGNKHYSPETCLFVSPALNALLNDSRAARGDYPQGVHLHKQAGKFRAVIKKYGKFHHLGLFQTPEEASEVYIKAKTEHVYEIAMQQEDERIKHGLMLHVLALQGVLGEVA
ncbi:MAG: hypothetical protein JRJ45_00285 [Deltaproteobacteria bacterium]|nr:hypothetical protein [Deltaproteobacteria bacterium]